MFNRDYNGFTASRVTAGKYISWAKARTGGAREVVGIMRDLTEQEAQAEQRPAGG